MIEEVDEVIDEMIEKKNVKMDSTFNVAIINVLWQIVASKRFDPHAAGMIWCFDLRNKIPPRFFAITPVLQIFHTKFDFC